MTEFGLAFMAGLAGGGQCLGLCGGILAAMAVAAPVTSAGRRFRLNLAYHIGRIITYTLLGLLAGAASQAALVGSLKPRLYWLFAAANILVVVVGLSTAFGLRRLGLAALDGAGWGFMSRVLGRSASQASIGAFLAEFFPSLRDARPDEGMVVLDEIFHLETQLDAARRGSPTPPGPR